MSSVEVADAVGQLPALIHNESFAFFIEECESGVIAKTLTCAVDSYPAPSVYKWLVGGNQEV